MTMIAAVVMAGVGSMRTTIAKEVVAAAVADVLQEMMTMKAVDGLVIPKVIQRHQ